MTSKQILDSFSESLMQDERILSVQERSLLSNLIHHARAASLEPQTYEVVNATIAAAVGETVAQRAFSVLGASIVERILAGNGAVATRLSTVQEPTIHAWSPSVPPPGSQPGPPRPADVPIPPPGPPRPADVPADQPGPPRPNPPGPAPQPPSGSTKLRPAASKTAVLERPQGAMAQCVTLDEFLAPQELQELMRFTLEHEADFCASEVIAPDSGGGSINQEHRRSRVLMDLGKYQELMVSRVQSALPLVLSRLGMEEFSVAHVEAQITASNHGDFFRSHNDNGDPKVASRQLTFVYFFHREPSGFEGGELRIHASRGDGSGRNIGAYRTIMPQQNQIVFFPCSAQHEITPVECRSRLFADSRFTLNGWLHR